MPFDGAVEVYELTPRMAAQARAFDYYEESRRRQALWLNNALRCLEKTRETLDDRHRWIKRRFKRRSIFTKRQQYCLVGALRHHGSGHLETKFVSDAIHELHPRADRRGCNAETIWRFNDRFWTRHRHVVGVLDHAIHKVRDQLASLGV